MIKEKNIKTIILGISFAIISLLLVISVVNGINFGSFKILSLEEITTKKNEVNLAETNLELEKTRYEVLEEKLNKEKQEFIEEKNKYEAISDETIDIINKINTKEKYSIEYIWIKLGNYAKQLNLSIVVAEPGNSLNQEEVEESIFKIQVSGSYSDISEFIFNIENDDELRFKLDNINMEYVSGTVVKATFDVKDIVIVK